MEQFNPQNEGTTCHRPHNCRQWNSIPSNIVDLNSPTANMYGCEPCPECGDTHRCIFNNKPGIIQCDACGYEEKAENAYREE